MGCGIYGPPKRGGERVTKNCRIHRLRRSTEAVEEMQKSGIECVRPLFVWQVTTGHHGELRVWRKSAQGQGFRHR